MPSRLGRNIGDLLRRERELRRLTQQDLAVRAGVTQATVARVENGTRNAAIPLVERLFAVMGRQLTLGVEELEADVDQRIAELAARPIVDRIAETDLGIFRRHAAGISHVFDGATAALLQGAPVPAPGVHVALLWSEAEAITEWLTHKYARRWMERWQEYRYIPVDPREPYPHRWQTMAGEIFARMCDELPESIEIRHGAESYRVVPLAEVELVNPGAAGLLCRYRELRREQQLGGEQQPGAREPEVSR
jgi:transcriptional regulator with XRE-family HTH domain